MPGGVNLGSAYGEIVIDVSDVHKGINSAHAALSGFHGSMQQLGANMRKTGKSLSVAVTAPLAAFGALTAKTTSEFEADMNVLGVAARDAGVGLDVLQEAAVRVGADTELVGVSASQATAAMTNFYKAGLKTSDIFADLNGYLEEGESLTGALRSAVDLTAASNLDLAGSSDAVAIAMATFGIGAEEATDIADSFVQAADASVAEVGELVDAMKNVGPVAAQFGWSLQETNTALALLSERGIRGAEAGTALRSMMTNLQRPTNKVQEALRDLNVELYDSSGQMYDLPTIIGQLEDAFEDLTEEEKNLATQTIAGTYGMRALNTLVKEGKSGWRDMVGAVADAASAQQVAEARTQGLAAVWEQFQGTLETFMIKVGMPLIQDILTPLVEQMTEVLGSVTDQNPAWLELGLVVGGVAAAMGPVLIVAGQLVSSLGALSGVVAGLGAAASVSLLGPVGLVAGLAAAGVYLHGLEQAHRNEAASILDSSSSYENYTYLLKEANLEAYAFTESLYDQAKATKAAGESLDTLALQHAREQLRDMVEDLDALNEEWDLYGAELVGAQGETFGFSEKLKLLITDMTDLQLVVAEDVRQMQLWLEAAGLDAVAAGNLAREIQALAEAEELHRINTANLNTLETQRVTTYQAMTSAMGNTSKAMHDVAETGGHLSLSMQQIGDDTTSVTEYTQEMIDAMQEAVDAATGMQEAFMGTLASGLVDLRGKTEAAAESAAEYESEMSSLQAELTEATRTGTQDRIAAINEEIAALETAREKQIAAEKEARDRALIELALNLLEQTGQLEAYAQQRFVGPDVDMSHLADEGHEVLALLDAGLLEVDSLLGTLLYETIGEVDGVLDTTGQQAEETKNVLSQIADQTWADDTAARMEWALEVRRHLPEEEVEGIKTDLQDISTAMGEDPFAPVTASFETLRLGVDTGTKEAIERFNSLGKAGVQSGKDISDEYVGHSVVSDLQKGAKDAEVAWTDSAGEIVNAWTGSTGDILEAWLNFIKEAVAAVKKLIAALQEVQPVVDDIKEAFSQVTREVYDTIEAVKELIRKLEEAQEKADLIRFQSFPPMPTALASLVGRWLGEMRTINTVFDQFMGRMERGLDLAGDLASIGSSFASMIPTVPGYTPVQVEQWSERQKQLTFLEQQGALLELIEDHGLRVQDVLGSLDLGLDARPYRLESAMGKAFDRVVEQLDKQLREAQEKLRPNWEQLMLGVPSVAAPGVDWIRKNMPTDWIATISTRISGAGGTFAKWLLSGLEEAQARLDEMDQAVQRWGMPQYPYSTAFWEERKRLTAEIAEGERQILEYQRLQGELDFLEEQQKLLDLIQEHGLNVDDVLRGLKLGMDTGMGDLLEAVKRAMRMIVHQAEEELGIASPSKVFEQIGQQAMAGLARGLDVQTLVAARSSQNATRELIKAATAVSQSRASASPMTTVYNQTLYGHVYLEGVEDRRGLVEELVRLGT